MPANYSGNGGFFGSIGVSLPTPPPTPLQNLDSAIKDYISGAVQDGAKKSFKQWLRENSWVWWIVALLGGWFLYWLYKRYFKKKGGASAAVKKRR